MASTSNAKRLIAIDFDRTIVKDVTDIVARNLVEPSKIPENIQQLHSPSGWIPYMQEIFKIIHENGFRKEDIFTAIRNIPEVPGMIKCLKMLYLNNFDIIIISDSNSELINEWNKASGLSEFISEIFTNPSYFNEDGVLHVQPFHSQSECPISTINLCKGNVLQEYLEHKLKHHIIYKNIFYIGDGYHDICPMLRLTKSDFACPRIDFPADKQLYTTAEKVSANISAHVLTWNDGNDLLDQIVYQFEDFTSFENL